MLEHWKDRWDPRSFWWSRQALFDDRIEFPLLTARLSSFLPRRRGFPPLAPPPPSPHHHPHHGRVIISTSIVGTWSNPTSSDEWKGAGLQWCGVRKSMLSMLVIQARTLHENLQIRQWCWHQPQEHVLMLFASGGFVWSRYAVAFWPKPSRLDSTMGVCFYLCPEILVPKDSVARFAQASNRNNDQLFKKLRACHRDSGGIQQCKRWIWNWRSSQANLSAMSLWVSSANFGIVFMEMDG